MDKEPNSIEALYEMAGNYLETRVELTKFKTVDKVSRFSSSLATTLVILFFASLLLFFASVATAIWIGGLTGKLYEGFFIVAAFYLLVTLFLFVLRKQWIRKPVLDSIIKRLLN